MAQRDFRRPFSTGENVLGLPRSPSPTTGSQALDLVYQAADLFRGIEDRVRATEMRADTAERAQLDIIGTTERKLRDASKALAEAQKRIETQQDQLAALEYRAQTAEAEVREARQTLAQVEDAIRRRLLLTGEQPDRKSPVVA
jgi:chromosome segregation ATPase